MKKGNKALAFIKNTAIFFIGNVLSKIIGFLLLPLYTSIVPADEMGIYDISVTLVTMILSVCYFEIWSAALRYLYDGKSEEEKNSVIRSGLLIFLASSAVFFLVNTVVFTLLGYKYVLLILGYGISYAAMSYFTFIARGLGLNRDFSISGVLNTVVQLAMNVLLLVYLHMDYSALFISYIIGTCTQVLYLLMRTHTIHRIRNCKDNRTLTFELLKYALPLCLNTVAYWFLNSSNRLVYNWLFGNESSGIYSIGGRFGSIIALATTCFTYAWQDLAFASANDDTNHVRKLYITACNKYQQFLSASTVLILPAIKIVFPFLIKGNYVSAENIVPSFIIVAVISGYSAFIGNIFYAIKDTKIISISTVIAAVVNLIVCYPFIRYGGALGTNLSIMIAFAVNIGIRAVILKKRIGFSICPMDLLRSIVWIGATTAVYVFFDTAMQFVILAVNMVLALLLFKKDIRMIFKQNNEIDTEGKS